jgi:hypothetical protein
MGGHDGDLLPLQALLHELPVVTGVYGAINPSVSQGKEDTMINWIDEQLLDGLILQTGVAGPPGAPPVVRPENTVSLGAQIDDV